MKRGIVYNQCDCLDILETMEDSTYSLILLDIPENIGEKSRRITYTYKKRSVVSELCEERKCKLIDLSREEIQARIYQRRLEWIREYERYLFKIVWNCNRILNDKGVIVYLESGIKKADYDMMSILDAFFLRLETRVLEHSHGKTFSLIHFFTNNIEVSFPPLLVLESEERFSHKDERGLYRLDRLDRFPCNSHNYFEWQGMLPLKGRGWRYSKRKMDDLFKSGNIVIDRGMPKEKIYRDEHPVQASPIWNEYNIMDRVLSMFTKKDDYVLGVYAAYGFSRFSDERDLFWRTIVPEGYSIESCLRGNIGNQRLEKGFVNAPVIKRNDHIQYPVDIHLPFDERIERSEMLRESKRTYIPDEVDEIKIGTTTDEIIEYHVNEFMRITGYSESYFLDTVCGHKRQIFFEMRKKNRELCRVDKVEKALKAARREFNTIICFAVYSHMPYEETVRALRASNCDFNIHNQTHLAIIEWMCDDKQKRTIGALNSLIQSKWKNVGISEDKIENELFNELIPPKTKKCVVER